jgi:hypothetical protein
MVKFRGTSILKVTVHEDETGRLTEVEVRVMGLEE